MALAVRYFSASNHESCQYILTNDEEKKLVGLVRRTGHSLYKCRQLHNYSLSRGLLSAC